MLTVLLAFLAVLNLAGCAVTPAVTPAPQNMVSFPPQTRWQQMVAAESKPVALKGLARIDIITSASRYPLKVAILLQHPDHLRLESLPLFGPPDFYLAVDKETVKVLLPQEGKYYSGPPSPARLASFLPFLSSRFQLSDMLALLRGAVPLIRDSDITLRGYREEKYDRLEVYRGERIIQVFWLERESNTLVRASLRGKNGEPRYTAQFEGYGSLKEAADFPAKISVTTEDLNPVTLTLRYTDLQILEEISADLFTLEIPEGMEPMGIKEE